MAKQRDIVIDLVKLFAIFLVLWGHALMHLGGSDFDSNPVERFIYGFHMPLFIAMVGYFSGSLVKLSFKEMFVKKFRQLLLPAISSGVFIALLNTYGLDWSLKAYLLEFKECVWFLKCAFLCCCLSYCAKRVLKNPIVWVVASLIASQLVHSYNFNMMYPCFLFGVLMANTKDLWRGHLRASFAVSALLFVVLSAAWVANPVDLPIRFSLPAGFPAAQVMLFTLLRLLLGCTGTMATITGAYLLFGQPSASASAPTAACNPALQKLSKIGGETLGIYVFQIFLLEILLPRFLRFCGVSDWMESQNIGLFSLVITPLISLAILFLCVAITRALQRSRLLAYLFLGQK
jgi:fucose 4-O-acetylase-like acetyltransferase